MLSSRILQIVGSLAIACVIGLVQSSPDPNPWVEPEYGAVSTDYKSEQGVNSNYATTVGQVSRGSRYGDDYMTIAESQQRPRRRAPPRRRKGGRGRPPHKGRGRHGPPHKEEHHHHGWGGWDGKTDKIVIHHYHAKPEKKKKSLLPRLKFVPFGMFG